MVWGGCSRLVYETPNNTRLAMHLSRAIDPNSQPNAPQRALVYSAPSAAIPRRFQQSTLALQMGLANSTSSTGTSTQIGAQPDYTTPFDYQAYLSRTARTHAQHEGSGRNQFRSKVVCILSCKHCQVNVCQRGMKAILLADMNVELYSTDASPYGTVL